MNYGEKSILKHREWKGKIEVVSRVSVANREELSVAYTPGVAEPCLRIQKDPALSYEFTRRGNLVAVVTDGTAVLGLGNIGALAGMPVMEGKAVLFKRFADVDAIPIVLSTQDEDEIVETVIRIAGSFGGINLEDIAAPKCFSIEKRLIDALNIPVFHDDQHGTAIVTLAALINALYITGKKIDGVKICINGPGAAGNAIARLLLAAGAADIVLCDRAGALHRGRDGMDSYKQELAELTNHGLIKGGLVEAVRGADVFIGVSAPGVLSAEMVKTMNRDPIIFAMANPVPEIMPDVAIAAGAAVVGTGRSDFANQINNVLAFPGIFRGTLDVRAPRVTGGMKMAAAYALADFLPRASLSANKILPTPFDEGVAYAVAKAVGEQAVKEMSFVV